MGRYLRVKDTYVGDRRGTIIYILESSRFSKNGDIFTHIEGFEGVPLEFYLLY